MPEPNQLAQLAEEQHLAGRHHAGLDVLRPYFVARDLDPVGAPASVRLSLDVSRVLREMGLAETAAGLWAALLPGLAGGRSIDHARWILLGAEACGASHEAGRTVLRLADISGDFADGHTLKAAPAHGSARRRPLEAPSADRCGSA